MGEHAVMAIIKGFQEKYLVNQQVMGFSVLDEERGILVAATFDQNYGQNLTNPIRRWVIYEHPVLGLRAFEAESEEDFKNFVINQCFEAAA